MGHGRRSSLIMGVLVAVAASTAWDDIRAAKGCVASTTA
jgi:hypothetical protein